MLIEQIIEFEWKGDWPPGRTYTSITAYFHKKKKRKSLKENLSVDHYLQQKYCRRQCAILLEPNHLQNLAPKCKILNFFFVSKRKIEHFNFLIDFHMLKI